MKDMQDQFPVGTTVNVNAHRDDVFNDFTGLVVGYKDNFVLGRKSFLVQVRDQDDNVWDCDAEQLAFNTDDIMHA